MQFRNQSRSRVFLMLLIQEPETGQKKPEMEERRIRPTIVGVTVCVVTLILTLGFIGAIYFMKDTAYAVIRVGTTIL